MSEPKLISPMLDNFVMGDPISDHHGIRCCPAIKEETDGKYIVKIISVPASPTQLDALLLSGAYADQDAALSYFKELANAIVDEASILNKLSEMEGYLPIESTQIVTKEEEAGFDVYLLAEYRSTLERKLRRGCMTHLGALNLGLDLCAALAEARQAGYIYVDLKPSNIYLSGDHGYRIGDIGFLKLDALKYASLPDRYRSPYTAPEFNDVYSELNATIDTYAIGLILYQVFNDGMLPVNDETSPAEAFPPPAYADYEMSEIILKACAPEAADRWQDPVALGEALVSYMQRNGAHDTPIVPTYTQETPVTEIVADESEPVEEPPAENQNTEDDSVTLAEESIEVAEDVEITEESIYTEDEEGNLTYLEDVSDETMEAHNAEEIDYEEVTLEVSDMLQQADELIAHEAPDPVVQPEPIDVPIPPLEAPTDEEDTEDVPESDEEAPEASEAIEDEFDVEPEDKEEVANDESDVVPADAPDPEPATNDADDESNDASEQIPDTKKRNGWVGKTILIVLVAALLVAGFFFYKSFYLQTIDAITLEPGGPGELTVKILSQIDESELSVVCTDTYGNQQTVDVENGKATFTQLTANSAYAIKVVTAGFHRLVGNTTAAYTTPNLTEIVQFTAITGADDGSAILNFTINGPDAEQWVVTYVSDDGAEQKVTFTGHMTTITGLTVGNEYNFTLAPESDLKITGTNTVAYTAKSIVKPERLLIADCIDNVLTAQWTVNPNAEVTSWTVRCYNDNFDETIVVTETTASFNIPDANSSYTIEVTATGMSVSERVLINENSLIVKDFTITDSDPNKLVLSWNPVSQIPDSGLVLSYSVGGAAATQLTVGQNNSAEITPVVPDCEYRFALQTADGAEILGGTRYYSSPKSDAFSGYSVSASLMEFMMCRTPSSANWDRYDLSESDYTTTFSPDDKASFLVRLRSAYDTSGDNINTMFVIRDEQGIFVSSDISTRTWSQMWWRNYCELDMPSIPQNPGKYIVSIYFNGALANQTEFTISE